MTTTKIINGKEYTFINSSRGNRSGFVHETKLYRDNTLVSDAKIQYYNRTWEVYTFQSVMKKAVGKLIESYETRFTDNWKASHNIKRLTKVKKDEMYEELKTDAYYLELTELYSVL